MSSILWAQQGPGSINAERGSAPAEQGSPAPAAGGEDGRQYGSATGSPREVLASFQRLSEQFQVALETYGQTHDRQQADRIGLVADHWLSLIDLSKVPDATRREVGALTVAYLLDIFNRIPLPALGDVPDATAFKADSPASFQIPGTPFRIVRIDSGQRQGEFLFSDHTVVSAPRFHGTVEHLPLQSSRSVRSWVSEFRQMTGPLVPLSLSNAVPENLRSPVLGTPVWKIAAVGVLTIATALFLLVWHRATTHPRWGGRAGERWRLLLSPVAMLLAGLGLREFFSSQIIVAGPFAAATYAGLTVVTFAALAWAFWVLVLAIFETAISRSGHPERLLDANILRLVARILGFVGGAVILAYGAQDIGLPVLSLIAGLGIGGLAIALAIRPTLENLIGGFVLFLDRPIRVGDFCAFGDRSGTVESIGIRSTQVRAADRTLITVPNAQFADLQIVNWAQCDRMLIKQTIGLRYETREDQLRYLVVKLREMLVGHPRIDSESVRVRFSGFGASSLDVDIRVYAVTREWNDFSAIKEDVQFRIMGIVEGSGTRFAIPSQTLYMTRDQGVDATLGENAAATVSAWRATNRFPFPDFTQEQVEQLDGILPYPPPGSPFRDPTREESADANGDPVSKEFFESGTEPPEPDSDAMDGREKERS